MASRQQSTDPRRLRRLASALRQELKPWVEKGIESGEFFGDFGGACAAASYALCMLLRKFGFKPVLVLAGGKWGCQHCYVEVDGYIIDITATQFGYTRTVQVTTRRSVWHKPVISRGRGALSIIKGWFGCQNPLPNRHVLAAIVKRAEKRLSP